MDKNNVLIIGSNGFLGQNLMKEFNKFNLIFEVSGISRNISYLYFNPRVKKKDWMNLSISDLSQFNTVIFASSIPLQNRNLNQNQENLNDFLNEYKNLCIKFNKSRLKDGSKFIYFSSQRYSLNHLSERFEYFKLKDKINNISREIIKSSNLLELVLPNIFGVNINPNFSNGLINTLILNSFLGKKTLIYGDVFVKKNYLYINKVTNVLSKHLISRETNDKIILTENNLYNNLEIAIFIMELFQDLYGIKSQVEFNKIDKQKVGKILVSDSFKSEIIETINQYRSLL